MRQYSPETKERIRAVLAQKQQRASLRTRETLARMAPVAERNNVIIIGAGISGLCSAYELERKGYNVTILEAQKDHLGGRIRTHRQGDSYSEFGAMRIPVGHHLTLQYVSSFGLKTREFIQENERTYAYIRGTRVNRNEAGKEALKSKFLLTDSERHMTADEIWFESVVKTLLSLSEAEQLQLYADVLSDDRVMTLDNDSLYDNLKGKNLSRAAIEYVSSIYGVTTYLNTALLEHLREEKEEIWLNGFREIEGGMDLLVKKFLEKIKAPIHAGAEVKELVNADQQAEVIYTHNEKQYKLSADWVICTIPLGVLSRLEIEKAFSKEKINAIRTVNYDSSTKIVSRCKERFWELNDRIYGGGSIWDGGLGHTWYPSDNVTAKDESISSAESLLLSSYTWGMHARRMDSIPEGNINHYVRNELKKLHPEANMDHVLESTRWSWDNHEWSAGAFAFFSPGDHTDLHRELVNHEKRILLAGEHCSLTHSWIQGSLESALEVCDYMLTHHNP